MKKVFSLALCFWAWPPADRVSRIGRYNKESALSRVWDNADSLCTHYMSWNFNGMSGVGAVLLQEPLQSDTAKASTEGSWKLIQCGWWLNSSNRSVLQVLLGLILLFFGKTGSESLYFWEIELHLLCNIFSCLWLTPLCQNIVVLCYTFSFCIWTLYLGFIL